MANLKLKAKAIRKYESLYLPAPEDAKRKISARIAEFYQEKGEARTADHGRSISSSE